jgi:Flp pilus assembly protein TadG
MPVRFHHRPLDRARRDGKRRGQSVVEFALILPVLLLILLFGIDFGRIFLGWINLNNVAKVAANYAAQNPTASFASGSEYQTLIANDMAGINCTTTTPYPAPVFPPGSLPGDPVTVTIGCQFSLLTPFLDLIIPNPVPVTSSSAFPVRSGLLAGATLVPVVPSVTPTPTLAPTPTPTDTPTPGVTPTPTPTATPTATPVPTPTPVPICTVPNLVGVDIKFAQELWGTKGHGGTPGANFTTTLVFLPLVGNGDNGNVTGQSRSVGETGPCASTAMTVTWAP